MFWDQIEEYLKEFINNITKQWLWFIDDLIDVIEGKRNHLCGKTQKIYVIDSDEAEERLANWQNTQRNKVRG
jgi:uncharacterized protein YjbJ (UPF0337 family)